MAYRDDWFCWLVYREARIMQCYMLLLLRFSIWTERNRPKSLLCFASSCFQIQQVHFPGLFLPKSLLSLSLSRLDSLHWQCIGNWMRGGFKAPRKLGKMYLQFFIISNDSFLLKCLCVFCHVTLSKFMGEPSSSNPKLYLRTLNQQANVIHEFLYSVISESMSRARWHHHHAQS